MQKAEGAPFSKKETIKSTFESTYDVLMEELKVLEELQHTHIVKVLGFKKCAIVDPLQKVGWIVFERGTPTPDFRKDKYKATKGLPDEQTAHTWVYSFLRDVYFFTYPVFLQFFLTIIFIFTIIIEAVLCFCF